MLDSAISSSTVASISSEQSSVRPICSVARPRWLWVATGTLARIRSICAVVEPLLGEALAGARGDELLGARAGGHAGRGDADGAAGAVLEGDRAPVQRVDLLRLHA